LISCYESSGAIVNGFIQTFEKKFAEKGLLNDYLARVIDQERSHLNILAANEVLQQYNVGSSQPVWLSQVNQKGEVSHNGSAHDLNSAQIEQLDLKKLLNQKEGAMEEMKLRVSTLTHRLEAARQVTEARDEAIARLNDLRNQAEYQTKAIEKLTSENTGLKDAAQTLKGQLANALPQKQINPDINTWKHSVTSGAYEDRLEIAKRALQSTMHELLEVQSRSIMTDLLSLPKISQRRRMRSDRDARPTSRQKQRIFLAAASMSVITLPSKTEKYAWQSLSLRPELQLRAQYAQYEELLASVSHVRAQPTQVPSASRKVGTIRIPSSTTRSQTLNLQLDQLRALHRTIEP